METLLHEVLSNAGWATALALGAALAVPLFRQRPALIHGLWVLVLLKLVTPSLVHLTPTRNAAQTTIEHAASRLPAQIPRAAAVSGQPFEKVPVPPEASATRPTEAQAEGHDRVGAKSWPWRMTAVVLWLGGVAAWWLAVGLQVFRFRRLLQAARPAPEALCARTARLAARLGLRHAPAVWLVPAGVPPMIWAPIVPPRMLLPEGLWERLDEQQQDTVLAHEMAHLRRRDHWVRRLEAVVLGLYWWDPVAWWARHQVEQAEEQCCDSWVLWALPEAAEAYAEALVATAVFLSGPRRPWPVGATGVGRVHPLRRRLSMILRDPAVGLMARPAPRAALIIGVLSLLLLPA
ncbi:MAG: M56 family metallopeptidase [Acidimicrobiales bacterium]